MKNDLNQVQNLLDLSRQDLKAFTAENDLPSYRADQIWQWIYRHYADSFDQMSNLPSSLRKLLEEKTSINIGKIVSRQESNDGQTVKVLFRLGDGSLIETVLMRYEKRRTLCISTQVGCAMGCVFCATGQMGFFRNLSVGEITGQVLHFARLLAKEGDRLTNIVMMGMGEPLHNYSNSLQAIDNLIDEDGFNIGARKITVSTVGLVPAIRRFADERRQTPLAVSLHAATDEERDGLIPVNHRWPLSKLMDACRYYVAMTGRRITFEWALINGENDTKEQAEALANLVQDILCHVNLIPLNPTKEYFGKPSSRERVSAFQRVLEDHGIGSTVRVRRGIDIQAGCGQLRDRVLSSIGQDIDQAENSDPLPLSN